MSKRLGAIEHERGFMKLGASSSRQTERLLWLMVHGTCKKVSPNTINQCYHSYIYYYYGSFGILSYQHYLGSPFSYRGHRAFGTVAVSIVYLCSYTVTSAVTLPLMLPTQSTTSLFVCLSCQKKKIKKLETLPLTHRCSCR